MEAAHRVVEPVLPIVVILVGALDRRRKDLRCLGSQPALPQGVFVTCAKRQGRIQQQDAPIHPCLGQGPLQEVAGLDVQMDLPEGSAHRLLLQMTMVNAIWKACAWV